MIEGMFVFDGVVHLPDFTGEAGVNSHDATAEDKAALVQTLDICNRLTGGLVDVGSLVEFVPPHLLGEKDAIFESMFQHSPIDMAMIGNMPFAPPFISTSNFGDADRLIRLAHEFTAAHPERCMFAGGTDPSELGLEFALEHITFQIRELGARSMKFYPFGWRCDDRDLAYPMYERCRDLGVSVIQFHKSLPVFNVSNIEMQMPNDLQQAARDFPDMTFVMHHPQQLYFEETVAIAAMFPNIHLLVAPMLHLLLLKPRAVQKMLGRLLQEVGSEKLLYGSEGPVAGDPRRVIDAFMKLEIPDDLRDGYGYPQISRQDKANIMGLNYGRLFAVDVEAKKQVIASLPAGR